MKQFDIMRALITIEENLYAVKEGLSDYGADEEEKLAEKFIADIRSLRAKAEEFFAP